MTKLSPVTSRFYAEQRAAWMLRCPMPSQGRIDMQGQMDRNKNPHNDHYKPKLRSEAEIHADLAREFADEALTQIYGIQYRVWRDSMTQGNHSVALDMDQVFRDAMRYFERDEN